jgi:hypothetical protein
MVVGFSGLECAHAVFYQLDKAVGRKGFKHSAYYDVTQEL